MRILLFLIRLSAKGAMQRFLSPQEQMSWKVSCASCSRSKYIKLTAQWRMEYIGSYRFKDILVYGAEPNPLASIDIGPSTKFIGNQTHADVLKSGKAFADGYRKFCKIDFMQ